MLTERAGHERNWRRFPELGKLLDDKQLSVRWTGATSVSDTMFDEMNRLLTIFALVQDHEKEVALAIGHQGDSIRADLMELSRALKWASKKFSEASELTSQIAHKV